MICAQELMGTQLNLWHGNKKQKDKGKTFKKKKQIQYAQKKWFR